MNTNEQERKLREDIANKCLEVCKGGTTALFIAGEISKIAVEAIRESREKDREETIEKIKAFTIGGGNPLMQQETFKMYLLGFLLTPNQ